MILQHALKDLLLAAPVDRFNRFATLLGLEELEHNKQRPDGILHEAALLKGNCGVDRLGR